jgi:DNA repair protein RadC
MEAKKAHKGEGHRQRLRERFLASGLDGFHDYEVIELLLTLAMPRKDCKDAAKAALLRFKTLQGVLEAAPRELCRVNGIGPKNFFGIKLIKAVADRYLKKKLIHKDALNDSKALFDYLYHSIGEVIQTALSHDAAALIFAHNHPSGDPKPSSEDVAITRQLVFACKVMGLVAHEHIIIGDNRYFSFADQGYIERMNREFEKLRIGESDL